VKNIINNKKINSNWLCFKTENRKEFFAKASLKALGFKVVLPYYMKIIRHARKKYQVPSPVFPSYGFLSYDGEISSLNKIKYCRGVKNYLHQHNGYPQNVTEGVIKAIQLLQQEDGSYRLDPNRFRSGDKVKIIEGVLAGMIAIVKEKIDERRTQLLVNLLGRINTVNLDCQMIEKA